MAKYQIDPRKLKMSDMNKELVESNYTFWPGTFDQHGRPIVYILLGRFEKAQSARDMMLYTFYFFYKWQQTLPLSAWRAGVTCEARLCSHLPHFQLYLVVFRR